jgi:hypothetical protein
MPIHALHDAPPLLLLGGLSEGLGAAVAGGGTWGFTVQVKQRLKVPNLVIKLSVGIFLQKRC